MKSCVFGVTYEQKKHYKKEINDLPDLSSCKVTKFIKEADILSYKLVVDKIPQLMC